MSREELMRQCTLKQGNKILVAWIPNRGAKLGAWVELKTYDGKFWEVIRVGEHELAESMLRLYQGLNRKSLRSIQPITEVGMVAR